MPETPVHAQTAALTQSSPTNGDSTPENAELVVMRLFVSMDVMADGEMTLCVWMFSIACVAHAIAEAGV